MVSTSSTTTPGRAFRNSLTVSRFTHSLRSLAPVALHSLRLLGCSMPLRRENQEFSEIYGFPHRQLRSSPNSGVNSNPDKIPVKRLQETVSVKEQFPEVLFLLRQLPFLAKIYETSFFLKEAHHYNQLQQLP